LSFQPASGSYTLTGGSSLQLGGGVNASVASGATATINSQIAGSGGLSKGGAGTLILGGSNTFTGAVAVSQGTLQIGSDAALGDATNDVAMTGTLKTTANLSLDSGRDLTGSGNFSIAPGTTLTVNGSSALVGTTLTDAGTLSLQGAGRAVGALTFTTAARLEASGPVSVGSGITASGVTSGSAVINAGVTFNASGDKTVDVGGGGTLAINGDVAGTTGRIAKTGSGTLVINGSNSTGGLRIGASSATPTPGGTVVLAASQASGTNQMQINSGTLATTVPGGVTVPAGVSVGGRSNGVAAIGGTQPITFTGSSSFYRSFGTTGEIRFDVNNATTFSGTLGPTTGSGSSTGVTIGGTGTLILAATAVNASGTNFTDRLTVNSGATVRVADQNALAFSSVNTSGGGTVAFSVPAATFSTVTGTGPLALKQVSNAPVVLTLSQTSSGTYAGGFSGPGSVVKNGASTLTLAGVSTHTGTTSVQEGTLAIANASALGASTLVVANNASTVVADYIVASAGGLDLAADGLINVSAGGMTVGTTSAAAVVARILEGRGDGSWNGTKGITSSAAAASAGTRTMGWVDNGDGTVTFAFAADGDTNLDWQVDILDSANFLAGGKLDSGLPASWSEGDFTYDGFVDILDSAAFLATGLLDSGPYNPPAGQAGGIAAVPEPSLTGLGLLAAAGAVLLSRRRLSR
ncbi:MAG: beta strand repeat-containing protein, partial [Planctomycetaceae bacterium]